MFTNPDASGTRRPPEVRRLIWLVAAILLTLVVGYLATSGPPSPTPNPPGTFSFAALGDAPYHAWEDVQYRLVLQALDAHDLSWVLHVGDIFSRPCTDELYTSRLGWFNGLRHPVIYTPGDNEWRDCWHSSSGAFVPQERLDRIRQIFFGDPARSLGGRALSLVRQGNREPYPEFVENVRWAHERFVFATVHLVGRTEGREPTTAEDDAAKRRNEAAAAWLRETFAEAEAQNASGVVLGFHGGPSFEGPVDDPNRKAFEPFLTTLEEEVEQFPKPVLAAHGDHHRYTVDHPLVRRTTLRRLANFTRLQVPGSPEVGWVRVVVTPGADAPFAFEEHVVPRWKYW